MGSKAVIRIHRIPQPHVPAAPRVPGRNLQSRKHTLNPIEVAVLLIPDCGLWAMY
jgi:hypothetical protein